MFSRSDAAMERPGYMLNWYPESAPTQPELISRLIGNMRCLVRAKTQRFKAFGPSIRKIDQYAAEFSGSSSKQQLRLIRELRTKLRLEGLEHTNLLQAFGMVKSGAHDVFGFHLHDEQMFCAWALMHGLLPEMATGEGKSVTAAVAATVAALAGLPVHVITTNDYLVERDAQSMQVLFGRFNVSSSFVTPDHSDEQRREAYGCDVCYVSNKQLVFDYLRDRQTLGNRPGSLTSALRAVLGQNATPALLRGLCFAIVDEADSVLIDDAITPLVLSQQLEADGGLGQSLTAISLAQRLQLGDDFRVDSRVKSISIMEQGEDSLSDAVRGLDGVWKNRRYRHELVRQALSALHLFQRDVDYLVREGEVVLIDQSTGRVMSDRKLQHGLHQMIEVKERCELSGRSETLSSMSFQTFFQRYKHLCGMTGTAREASVELRRVYDLGYVPVPTHNYNKRIACPSSFAETDAEHAKMLVAAILERHDTGQPILIGTRSLAQSERISELLEAQGLLHALLNARQDEEEASIVSRAGARGAVTIATNIAGRGTDIPISPSIAELGGLHVIVAELNDNERIDRQLIGRCARQADPGSYEYLVSLEDPLLNRFAPRSVRWLRKIRTLVGLRDWNGLCLMVCQRAQRAQERAQRSARKQVAAADDQMKKRLTFTGYKE